MSIRLLHIYSNEPFDEVLNEISKASILIHLFKSFFLPPSRADDSVVIYRLQEASERLQDIYHYHPTSNFIHSRFVFPPTLLHISLRFTVRDPETSR